MDSVLAPRSDPRRQAEEAASQPMAGGSPTEAPRVGRGGPTRATAQKIKELDELAALLNEVRASGRRIVHCHGVFDLLHIGHIRHFEAAKQHGDVLVVTLTPDKYVNKGPHRPAFPQDLRAEMIASLGCVDYVAINTWPMGVARRPEFAKFQLAPPSIVLRIPLLVPTYQARGSCGSGVSVTTRTSPCCLAASK